MRTIAPMQTTGGGRKRYGVSLQRNRYLQHDLGRDLFDRVKGFAKLSDEECEGEVPVLEGRAVKVAAMQPLGDDADYFVTSLEPQDRLALQKAFPTVSIEEDAEGRMAMYTPEILVEAMAVFTPKQTIFVDVKDETGAMLADVDVRMVVNVIGPIGAIGKTNAQGRATLILSAAHTQAVYVTAAPEHTRWPGTAHGVALADQVVVSLTCPSIASAPNDNLDAMFHAGARGGAGVIVAIVDGGVGPHADVPVAKALPYPGEADTEDNGVGHGTHVAGIVRRMAPKAELRSYRVFPAGSPATSASIVAAAIRRAVLDGAHVINVSITFDQDSPALQTALQLAQAKGAICVCAAGNSAGPVLCPARSPLALAVAACSERSNAWPGNALDHELGAPPGTTFADVVPAAFTCFGSEITLTAPGVGIVSSFPNDRRAVMSGTSMSAPVVTGLLATALSSLAGYLQGPADASRSATATSVGIGAATLLGLQVGYEGHGVPFLP
jgi:subtilisin